MIKELVIAATLLFSGAAAAQGIQAVPPPSNGNLLEQGYVFMKPQADGRVTEVFLCMNHPVTRDNVETAKSVSALLACVEIPRQTFLQLKQTCGGISSNIGPDLLCGDELKNYVEQKQAI